MARHVSTLIAVLLCLYARRVLGVIHECERSCVRDADVKNCYYHFTLGVSYQKCTNSDKGECRRRMTLSINGGSPGPFIIVCRNDNITVDVRNVLPLGMETSIHWHGLKQRRNFRMDGVPLITQCPIHSGTTFRYRMRADQSGTFYYQAHSVLQQLDGIYGAIIVRKPFPEETAKPDNERIVIMAPQINDLKSVENDVEADLSVAELKSYVHETIPEDEDNELSTVRIRLINVAAINCPLSLMSDRLMTVVAVDGNDVEPLDLKHFLLYPGERTDILISSEHSTAIEVIGRNQCLGHKIIGLTSNAATGKGVLPDEESDFYSLNVSDFYKSLNSTSANLEDEGYPFYLSFSAQTYSPIDNRVDFRYKMGEMAAYVPSYINSNADSVSIYQFNKISFLYPPSPSLMQSNDIDHDVTCYFGRRAIRCDSSESKFCACLHILELPFNKSVDLIMVYEGKRDEWEQTFHIHGNSFRITRMEQFAEPITMDKVKRLMLSERSKSNLVKPVEKDTTAVPSNGYAVLRLKTDNPGAWLLESIPSKAKSDLGLELILQIADPNEEKNELEHLPQCGSMKPPDLIIFEE